ncbi:MAG: transglycosylase SLT domain-containing protein [Gammaproteobacteria bacterium]|nr:transglycosylase SLT domain-containing protein [Gammaproteobacteria bacterium]MBU2677298.1 transglycosylase SLT domain-containing protein [Gammaproteobacteria bacterium]NNC57861.1 transglycosylase SLT domain-containing protein [Woeseiaceae bacterium]NNL51029.1 transglycosylase SLT domain-containing protein [Woeseiaceae bacterium]
MTRRFVATCCRLIAAAFLAGMIAVPSASANGTTALERQRQLFMDVFEAVERGDWSAVEDLSTTDGKLLRQYVLWPDLQATYWRATIKKAPAREIDAFLNQYGTLRPARELRYRHALQLARSGDLHGYQAIYEQYYQGQNVPKLDCLSLQAELAAGRWARVNGRALDLWLVGKSQVDECDPVFEYLAAEELLGTAEYRKRYELAIDAREFQLARWLAKKIDDQHVEQAALWMKAQAHPEDFLESHHRRADSDTARRQLVYAAERLTYRDPVAARKAWASVSRRVAFSEEQRLRTARHIALWTARDNLPGAYELLLALPDAAADSEVSRWRARTSLKNLEWDALLLDVATMSQAERDAEEWQYWRAVALQRLGQVLAARAAFERLSEERSYYGFLAADELGQGYSLDHSQLLANEAAIAAIESRPEVVRARELFLVGQDSRGRSEWDAIIRSFSADEKLQATILANRWGWHSRAIATAASVGEYDDLSIRYPLPYQNLFEQSSSEASISPTWAYGIARSESLFMRDVRSQAGAIGLMQLMPTTGRAVAKQIRLPYSGLHTLTNPASNIRLGTTYLGQMAERYNGNPVLATAAYNAGPHRVDRWLPESGSIDARVWIENIPFNETRKYVKRVLSAQAIFHWRMTGQVRRLSDELLHVRAARDEQQLALR